MTQGNRRRAGTRRNGAASQPGPAQTRRKRQEMRAAAVRPGARSVPVQLVEIVRHADQGPFKARFPAAPQQELTEAAGLLDLSEHRFDRDLAQLVAALLSRTNRAGAGCRLRPVLLAASGDISPDLARLQRPEVALRAVSGIGQKLVRQTSPLSFNRIKHRNQLVLVAAGVADAVGDDHLITRIRRSLGVPALDEAVPGPENAALGVGEIWPSPSGHN